MLLGGIHEVIVKKLVNCTWQHLKLEAPVGTKARDCRKMFMTFNNIKLSLTLTVKDDPIENRGIGLDVNNAPEITQN